MPVLKIKKADGTWQEVWGCVNASDSGASAPKQTVITMFADSWIENNNLYSQTVLCNGVNVNSKLDLQPTPEQIVYLQDAEISLMLTNSNGVVTAWAINGKPGDDITMDVLITEVVVV